MAAEGTQIILLNDRREVLLYLRDDKPEIRFPNHWCLLGGYIEPGETPAECIRREIDEELGVQLPANEIHHVVTHERDFGIEHTFHARVTFEIDDVTLTEGQGLRWMTETEAAATKLGYEDNAVLADFFESLDRQTTY